MYYIENEMHPHDMRLGTLDLDTRFEYLIIYKHKRENTINTWTLGIGFKNNYQAMLKDKDVEILGVYKKLTEEQLNILFKED